MSMFAFLRPPSAETTRLCCTERAHQYRAIVRMDTWWFILEYYVRAHTSVLRQDQRGLTEMPTVAHTESLFQDTGSKAISAMDFGLPGQLEITGHYTPK